MDSKIGINAEDVEDILATLRSIMEQIKEVSTSSFTKIGFENFYVGGSALEEMNRVFNKETRDKMTEQINNAIDEKMESSQIPEIVAIEADLYGKIYTLSIYYKLVMEFCLFALHKFQDQDEELKKLYNEITNKGLE